MFGAQNVWFTKIISPGKQLYLKTNSDIVNSGKYVASNRRKKNHIMLRWVMECLCG